MGQTAFSAESILDSTSEGRDLLTSASLADPNADRILIWDDSATGFRYADLGSGLSISGTTLNLAAGLSGIAGLADPNADSILFWDDSAGSYQHLSLGTGLSITGTTLNNTIDQSGYVPYTGATTNVNLGSNTLTASGVTITGLPSAISHRIDLSATPGDIFQVNTSGGSGGNFFRMAVESNVRGMSMGTSDLGMGRTLNLGQTVLSMLGTGSSIWARGFLQLGSACPQASISGTYPGNTRAGTWDSVLTTQSTLQGVIATIDMVADGSGGVDGFGGSIYFHVKADNSSTWRDTGCIRHSGNWGIGTMNPGVFEGTNFGTRLHVNGQMGLSSTTPFILFDETDEAANARLMDFRVSGGILKVRKFNDDATSVVDLFTLNRSTGATTFSGTGQFGGTVSIRNGLVVQQLDIYNTYSSPTYFETTRILNVAGGSTRIGMAVGFDGGIVRGLDFGNWNAAGDWGSWLNISSTGLIGIGTTTTAGARLELRQAGVNVAYFYNTAASSSSGGAGLQCFAADGAALASGDRLGFLTFSGSVNGSGGISSGTGIVAYAAEAYSDSAQGSTLQFQTTLIGAISRSPRLTFDGTGLGTFSGAVDVAALLQCNSFRIDQTPTLESIVPTHSGIINFNGTNYKVALQVA